MHCIILAPAQELALHWQYAIENLGPAWRASFALTEAAALTLLADGADLALLLPGPESRALLHTLTASAPLAAPYLLGDAAPDGPLPAPEDLPALFHRWRRTHTLPALTARRLPATTDIAAALFRTLEVPLRLRAWDFLPDMAALTVVHPPLLNDLQHGLYPLIAARHGLTPAAVERRLRLCVESTWMHGSLDAMERFFGSSVDPERGKPTNREFLCRVQERLTFTMERLI